MEAPGMEESKKLEEAKLTSAAAFVEGGIQDACDDACSICLEEFCESEPSTVTGCKHEFHFQCILEWCQRSSQCPMCWQPISLKDPTSQELLDAVVQERNVRLTPPRNSTIFHHPTLGEFEIQHLPVGVNDAELEERIIQHLAAAAAMGRARNFSRRESLRIRSSNQGRPQFLVFSAQPDAHAPTSSPDGGQGVSSASFDATPSSLNVGEEGSPSTFSPSHAQRDMVSISGITSPATGHHASPSHNESPSQSSPRSQDRAGPSDLHSFSETLKSRLNAVSTRYKESISKSTRGWKERLFSRNSAMSDIGTEVRREVNAGIATVSRMMERLETRSNGTPSNDSVPSSPESGPAMDPTSQDEIVVGPSGNHLSESSVDAPYGSTRSGSD